jgi:hypothetical protein
VVAGVLDEEFVTEPQHLGLVGDVAGVRGNQGAGRGLGSGYGHGLGHRVRVQVAARCRAALHRELTDQLAAHARSAAGHHRELVFERLHAHGLTLSRSAGAGKG